MFCSDGEELQEWVEVVRERVWAEEKGVVDGGDCSEKGSTGGENG